MKQLSWTDFAFLRMERPAAPLHVNPIMIYDPFTAPDGKITFKGVLDGVNRRLDQAPLFRRKLLAVPGGLSAPYWVDDPDFDIEYHVRHIALPKPGDWRQFCIQAARLHARPLDLTRPPWELTVIEGLDNIDGLPPGSFALSLKVHHAAIDGVEGVALINAIHDLSPEVADGSDATPEWAPRRLPSPLRLMRDATIDGLKAYPGQVRRGLAHVPGFAGGLGKDVGRGIGRVRREIGVSVPSSPFNGAVSPHRVFEARFHDFADVKRIKAAVPGATVNDVALAYVGGSLRHYLAAHETLPDTSLWTIVPVSTRPADAASSGGNMVSGMRAPVRTDIADPLARLAAINEVTSVDRAARAGVGGNDLVGLGAIMPGALVGIGLRAGVELTRLGPRLAPIANLTVTNVPGSRDPLYFAGARMVRSTGNGPLVAGFGLIHLISTYVNDFAVAVTADRDMLPDPGFYAECMQRSFDDLLEAATAAE